MLIDAATISNRTRKVYDRLAMVYPVFHIFLFTPKSRHAMEVRNSGWDERAEVATGSGEMFRRLVR